MHMNPAYSKTSRDQNLTFARSRGFGILAINGVAGPELSHVPFLLSGDGKIADAHMTRSNPVYRALADGPVAAKLAVNGPDSYISPDWYQIDDQVPTWNYVAVHLTGRLERRPDTDLLSHLEALSTHFETQLLPKPIWLTSKVTPDVLTRMMRMIAPVRFHVSEIQGTWKLAQAKTGTARLAAADGLQQSGLENPDMSISDLMKELPGDIA